MPMGWTMKNRGNLILQGMGYSLSTTSIQTIANTVTGTFSKDTAGTATAQTALNNALRTATGDNTKSFVFANTTEVENTFNSIVTHYEDLVTAWSPLGVIPESRERLALLSLAYNNLIGPGKSPSLRQALLDGDRAEAWYQIRYVSNGDQLPGIAKRRYQESELFGLYDNPAGISGTSEAASAYRMYSKHRAEIFTYEARYGERPDGGAGSQGNMINAANIDYPTSVGPAVQSLRTELTVAGIALEGEYLVNPGLGLPGTIDPLNIQMTSASLTALNGEDGTAHTGSARDLLIGTDNQSDTLNGNGGDDFLFGGSGDDNLWGGSGKDQLFGGLGADTLHGDDGTGGDLLDGGTGNDTYYADDGDTIRDADGKGTIYLNGKHLTFATRQKGETAYKDGAGNVFLVNGTTLRINDPLVIENFTSGDLGITLKEETDPDDPGDPNPGLKNAFGRAEATPSPLILDLDGNGIQTRGIGEGAYFDFDGNGFAERSGWATPADGILVRDLNGNQRIDNGGELFGDATQLIDGTHAANGFAALADLDGNHDGRIDAGDSAWSSLQIWQDANSDGIADSGELKTLAALGIQILATAYTTTATTDSHGNQHRQQGSFTRTDGSTALVEDLWLRSNPSSTRQENPLEVSESIRAMPNIQGMGNVASLWQVMAAEDASGGHRLKDLIGQFANESNPVVRTGLTNQILYAWAGVEGKVANEIAAPIETAASQQRLAA